MLYPNERAISFILSCRSLLLIIRSALLFIISISASRKSERKSEQNDKLSHHNISSCFFLYFLNKRMNIPEFFTSVHRFSKHALEKVFKKRLSQNSIGIFHLLLTFFTVPFCCVFLRTFFSSAASNFFIYILSSRSCNFFAVLLHTVWSYLKIFRTNVVDAYPYIFSKQTGQI